MSILHAVSGSTASRPRPILVVDEDRATFDIATRVAQHLGLTVRWARSAEAIGDTAAADPPAAALVATEIGGRPMGITIGRAIRAKWGANVILVAPALSPQQTTAVAAFGPDGVLSKPLRVEQVDMTLRLALKRRALAETAPADREASRPDLAHALRQISAIVNGTGVISIASETKAPQRLLATLRPREQEVVRLLFQHYRVPAIAAQLGISAETVRNHLKNVYRRVGVHSQQELLERFRSGPTSPASAAPASSLHVVGN
jgi:DNA-binding NarL/FixJ family response regulator